MPQTAGWQNKIIVCGALISIGALGHSANAEEWTVETSASSRLRVDSFQNPVFNLSSADDFTSLQYRLTGSLRAEHETGWSTGVQLGVYNETGRSPGPRRSDRNDGDILQAYVAYSNEWDDWEWQARLGRQLNPQGASRLNVAREAPNAVRSFDGLSVSARRGDVRLSAFTLRPVALSFGSFDDETDSTEAFWGVYLSNFAPSEAWNADLYYFGRKDENIRWAQGSGSEERHSVGGRLFGEVAGTKTNIEAIYQFGQFNSAPLNAWGLGWEFSREFEFTQNSIEMGLRGNIVSGDKDSTDPELQTFSAIYPRFAYYSPAATIAPTNSWDFQVFGKAPLGAKSTMKLTTGWINRLETSDAVYRVPYIPLSFSSESTEDDIASLYSLEFTRKLAWDISLSSSLTYGRAGQLIRTQNGKDFGHFAVTLSRRF